MNFIPNFCITFFYHNNISTYFFSLYYLPFLFFTSNFVHHKILWPLRPHSGRYPSGSLGQFSSQGTPSAVHDQVCALKRSAVCSASPPLADDMTGSNIFYCVLHTWDSVCELFWYIKKQCDKVTTISNLNLKTKKYLLYNPLIVQILVFRWRQKGFLFIFCVNCSFSLCVFDLNFLTVFNLG